MHSRNDREGVGPHCKTSNDDDRYDCAPARFETVNALSEFASTPECDAKAKDDCDHGRDCHRQIDVMFSTMLERVLDNRDRDPAADPAADPYSNPARPTHVRQ